MLVFPSHVLYYPWFPGNILSQRNRKWTCVPKDFFSRSPPLSQNLWPKASWGDNSRGERDSQKKIFKALFPLKSTHCGWRSIKLSHFQTFEFSCLKSNIKSVTFKKRNIRIFHQNSKVNPHKNLHQFRSRSKNSIFGFLLQNWRFFAR